jgi:hypothetical protein
VALEPDMTMLLGRLDDLTEYAWAFRYPGDIIPPSKPEISEASTLAHEIVRQIERRIAGAG